MTTLPFINFDNIALKLAGLDHYGAFMAFSLRSGGVSSRPFDSLNFSAQEGDSVENVDQNFRIFAEQQGIDPQQIVTCHQIHGDEVVVVSDRPNRPPEADAIISTVPSIYPAVKTADCLPILLVDPVHMISAAVHVGWRGAVLRIARKVVQTMNDRFKSNPEELIAAVGPGIGKCCYEVDGKVLKPFRENFPEADRFVRSTPKPIGHTDDRHGGRSHHNPVGPASLPATDWGNQPRFPSDTALLDLSAVARFELISGGIPESNIHPVDLCTSCRPDLFFSHRRDRGRTGRHIAVTGFKSA
ncbi:MAG: peptidoglycan editing factor PgeF [Desulfomonilaceae bacterium]